MSSQAGQSETTAVSKSKSKDKEKKPRVSAKGQGEPRLKIVVRRLPPNLPEDIFWQSVQSWVTEETVTWKVYYQGKFRKRLNKENIPSRAYIAFKDEELLATFSREYDGHLFRDKAGNESVAIVEFAPFQKVPGDKKKADTRIGTIGKDEDYISFLESLKENVTKPLDMDSLEALVSAAQPSPPPTTTPLLEALKAEKSAQKDKEAILRNHQHYKEHLPTIAAPPKREEPKKKVDVPTGPAQPAAQQQRPATRRGGQGKRLAAKAAAQREKEAASSKAAAPQQQAAQPKPPTTPKKQRQQAKAAPEVQTQALAAATASPATPATATKPTLEPAAQTPPAMQPSTAMDASTQLAAGVSAPRRRPVLGLASRQFEAALSGAGVRRREREKEKEPQASASTPTSAREDTKPEPLPPTILQREPQTPASPSHVAETLPREDSSRGGGRGRGRGRGRGGRGG